MSDTRLNPAVSKRKAPVMTKSSAYIWSRRALVGAAAASACVAMSIPVASAAASHPAATRECTTANLHASMGTSEGTAGAIYTAINFTNTSGSACTLYGFPGVSLSEGSPYKQVGQAAAENSASQRVLVTLAPGATGNAVLRVADAYNFPNPPCDPTSTTYVVVYPPNNTVPIHLKYPAVTCAGSTVTLLTNVVEAGSSS
jgi:hypothetical protein